VVLVAAIAVVLVLVLSKDKKEDGPDPTKSPKPTASESVKPSDDPDPKPTKTSDPPKPTGNPSINVTEAWCDEYRAASYNSPEEFDLLREVVPDDMKADLETYIEYQEALDAWISDPDAPIMDMPKIDLDLQTRVFSWIMDLNVACI
jgi:hypothetical protein